MRRVAQLVLGVGYLGAALAAKLVARGSTVVGMDNGFATDGDALHGLVQRAVGRLRVLRGDVRVPGDLDAAFRAAHPVEAVFLLAAQASAHPEAAPAEYTEETNLRGPRLVFEAALRHGAPPVVYGSSFHVYGASPAGVVDESHPYGLLRDLSHLSKIYAEKLGELYASVRGLHVVPVRLGVVYGTGPVMKRDLRFVTVPHAFCLRALAGQSLEVHATGVSPMALVHLDDAVEALRLAAESSSLPAGNCPRRPMGGQPGGAAEYVAEDVAAAPYAPANAAAEVASALDVAGLVKQAALARGLHVEVRRPLFPTTFVSGSPGSSGALPRPAGTAGSSPSRTSAALTVVSRLTRQGWLPRRRLAEALPGIFERYAASGERCA